MNNLDYGALIGMVLGDGYLTPYTHKAALSLGHCLKQTEYALFKVDYLKLPYSYKIYHTKKLTRSPHIGVVTKSSYDIMELRNQIYINRRKTITYDLLNRLTPLGLAFWYCDDGNYDNGSIVLSTNCFDYNEHILIVNYFNSIGIQPSIKFVKKKYYAIYFNRVNTLLFLKYIYPYCNDFPDCIKYKFGPLWEGNNEHLNQVRQNIKIKTKIYNLKNKDKKKNYYTLNKPHILVRQKRRYESNKEIILEKSKIYRQQNREKILQKHREYYQRNKEVLYPKTREWSLNHPNQVRLYKKRYRDTHKEERLEYQRKYRLQKKVQMSLALIFGDD